LHQTQTKDHGIVLSGSEQAVLVAEHIRNFRKAQVAAGRAFTGSSRGRAEQSFSFGVQIQAQLSERPD
jgi:hypothetical protein